MDLQKLVSGFSDELAPLKNLLLRVGESAGSSQPFENSISLDHRPKIAPEAYGITVWEPLDSELITNYERTRQITVHPRYRNVLTQIGGLRAFQLALFGIPKSMLHNPPAHDRTTLQPLDLSLALHDWAANFHVPAGLFYFGGGPHSLTENLGYFLDEAGRVIAILRSGKKVRGWPDFKSFLADELIRAEANYPKHEAFWVKTNAKIAKQAAK